MKSRCKALHNANRYLWAMVALTAASLCAADSAISQMPQIIPAPLSAINNPGVLQINDGATVSYVEGDGGAKFAAEHFAALLQRTRRLQLVVKSVHSEAISDALVVITRSSSDAGNIRKEAYDLTVSPKQVTITAASDAGLYYGTVTLWEMLTASQKLDGPVKLQCLQIHDAPQMVWRGIMLDSSRHMQSIEFIQQLIDWMSLEKLNVLHWHLTDDQGWRLEIKRYPKLTSVGAWRELPSASNTPSPAQTKANRYGGYYSQDEVRKLVAYAALRNVMIVPEIEMPGHASAALAAYPQFGSSDVPLTAPVNKYGVSPNLYNLDDATFTFIENVLDEVMQLFPSPYIHIGGDEAIKNPWKASPRIQAKMKQLGIGDEDELQSYFIKRIDTYLTAHGRRTLGWDEILQGGLAKNAAVMSWHGVQGGIAAAKQGHDAILTPSHPLYFDYTQSDAADDAPGRFPANTLADVYAFNPTPADLTQEERKHILGIQANLWTEYVTTDDRDEWMLFPRSAALAEVAWSSPDRRDWNDFLARVTIEMRRYHTLGINYDPAAFRATSDEVLQPGQAYAAVRLGNQTSFGALRYTTDGSPVTASSSQYVGPLNLQLPSHLRAAAFLNGGSILGSELDRLLNSSSVRRRYSQQMQLCTPAGATTMEPDPQQTGRPVVLANYKNLCWIYKGADLTGVMDVSVGVLKLPYVFSNIIPLPPLDQPRTPYGEVEVHADTCAGPLVSLLPLKPAEGLDGVTSLHGSLQNLNGTHDLCLKVVRPATNPLWVLDWVQLDSAPQKR
jgi:hexosaminidase